ncbi:hypothetical protein EDD17DRAFT_1512189 [Pisolithus thermaeus]|nr:hypothetical protein EV401DRAFT_1893701 [Pisolithus croceorrhizus]KAI6158453.1 hypothetical protein EDD17DRAFT_1512189 [Pisolithus thermaeus]
MAPKGLKGLKGKGLESSKIHFSKWNPQGIQSSEVMRLAELFKVNRLDCFNLTHTMPLIMPKSILKQEGEKALKIPAAGGQHQLYTLEIWLEWKKKQLDKHVALERFIKGQDPEKIDKAKLQKWNKMMKKDKDVLAGIIMYGGQWLVSLFDKSKINQTLAIHIFLK